MFRRGNYRDVAVMVGEFEPDRPRRIGSQSEAQPPSAAKTAIGLSVSDLTEAQKKELKLRGGVRVDAVEGPAARAGLREGDVVLSLDNVEVTDAKHFGTLVGKLDKAKPVSVLVRRGEGVQYVVIRPSALTHGSEQLGGSFHVVGNRAGLLGSSRLGSDLLLRALTGLGLSRCTYTITAHDSCFERPANTPVTIPRASTWLCG